MERKNGKLFDINLMRFKSDSLLVYTSILSLILCCCHLYQFIDSSFMPDPMVKAVICLVYPFFVFFTGRQYIPYYFFILAEVLVFLNGSFLNYTSFFIIALCSVWLPSREKYFLSFYYISTVAVCLAHDKSVAHLIIHTANCITFYIFMKLLIKDRFISKTLILTESERQILQELKEGKQQKEISLFSKNTITKKLRDAKARNQIPTTEELLMRFCLENQ